MQKLNLASCILHLDGISHTRSVMGIQFFIVFVLSIAFLSLGVTGWHGFVNLTWNDSFVFSTDLQFSDDLNQLLFPKDFQQEFENHGHPLPDALSISVKDKRNQWQIASEDNTQKYTVQLKKDRLYVYDASIPLLNLGLQANFLAIFQCFGGFLLFLGSLYLMGFFLYLEERESGRIMKSVKSFVKLRKFLEERQKR